MIKAFSEILIGFRRSVAFIGKQERMMLVAASLIMVLTGILSNLPAVILGQFVDKLTGTKFTDFRDAIPFLIIIIIIILVREGLTVIRKYLIENIATQTEKKQTVNTVGHLLKSDLNYINTQQIGSLHGRIIRSIQGLVRIIKLSFLEFLPVFFSALAALFIVFIQKPVLATVMILVIPSGLYIIIRQISSQKGIRVSLLRGKEKIDGVVIEMLGGIETIRTLNTEKDEIQRVESVAEELRKKEIKHHIYMAVYDSLKYLNEGFFYIVVISLSIFFSSKGVITKGDILVYSILFLSITAPLREIHRILDEAHESSLKVNDLYDILNQPDDISYNNTVTNNSDKIRENRNTIKINNLSFSYSNSKDQILKGINCTINKGEKIGIVGVSGCGKTTFVKIILRLIHQYQGNIYVFGKNLKNISREESARTITYIPQKTYIFSGTVRENILYGCSKKLVKDREIKRAMVNANLYAEIMNSMGGFDGKISENGNNLSGGQKQRLALARMMLRSPDVLIFDEATSALDNANERIIQKNIEKLYKDKTMITIAHRLTTLENSDRIFVFDRGKIIQEGTYIDLSREKGLFQDFLMQKVPDILVPDKNDLKGEIC